MSALDIPEPQVLVYYSDPNVEWHHRILLRRLQGSTWVVVTPDGDTQLEDLVQYVLIPLVRGAQVPQAY